MADETDGRFARKYQQTSTLGAVLDMVTDRYITKALSSHSYHCFSAKKTMEYLTLCRVATAGLLMLLCKAYPGWFLLFVILLQLDISSHWFQMYSTLVAGNTTHKVC